MKTFIVVWIGQLLSVIGSGLTSFGLGVWVLLETGSVTKFSFIMLAASLPAIIAAPFTGVLIDRFKRKYIMIIADSISGLATLSLLTLLLTNNLEIWHIYIIASVVSLFSSVQLPAYQSAISLMVPKSQLGRANGMVQLAEASSLIVGPVVAGFLIALYGLSAVVLVDLITMSIAITILCFAKIPEIEHEEYKTEEKPSVWFEAKQGLLYIKERPGLIGLMLYFATINFLFGFFNVLIQPLILSLSNETVLGTVISISGVGMFIGGILMSTWGGAKNKVKGLFSIASIFGVSLVMIGLTESLIVITAGVTLSFFLIPMVNAHSQSIFQQKVEPSVQGRVFSLRIMVSRILMPISIVLAGPTIDYIADPLMAEGGALASTVGMVIGVGEGRGIGLVFLVIGLLHTLILLVIYFHPRVRNMNHEIPDVLDEDEAKQVALS
ncbi:MFS transporter [Aquisalibacillus elongatus]|uniref:Na+/melibiose symporter-like transporter n=1 Tax=Aquisalibacillus elongatus TaxID=485577 RepID=A0A3N5C572_9BACI|nr:MFS transporter [Aquisalibacillus elongatus]RPF53315.1 Na+/melibiose symporter-like transporter [Aquisalibacillus elongatus]